MAKARELGPWRVQADGRIRNGALLCPLAAVTGQWFSNRGEVNAQVVEPADFPRNQYRARLEEGLGMARRTP